ncbi:MAG: DUF3108 domain-containing protein [Pyrinomonadaceae bacterium]|nr:DUF3108 domain-containing protein [Pyrinomonadaceae bacterium]
MKNSKNNNLINLGFFALIALTGFAAVVHFSHWRAVSAQDVEFERFREGEKLTYDISFENYRNAAYAEVFVASKGKLEGKSAVEIRGRLKSVDLVSAAFYLLDYSRTVFASQDTGLPLYIKDVSSVSGLPKEEIKSFLNSPATNLDLLTLFYRARETGGAGSFSVLEKGQVYSFSFAATGGERVTTAGRTFETNVSSVTSGYFVDNEITDVQVNFSTSVERVPVKISFRTPKGRFEALLAGISVLKPTPTPTPEAIETPTPTPTPTPKPAVEPKVLPLSPDLPFSLGEKLEYQVSKSGSSVGRLQFEVGERKRIKNVDSLVLKASVLEQGNGSLFSAADTAIATVDPFTLVPFRFEVKLAGPLATWSGTSIFDQTLGAVAFGAAQRTEVPVGTHSALSFAYALRSFNLRHSKDPKNPVNDTRVAVFAGDKALILTLRPSPPGLIDFDGEKISAQLVTIITGVPSVDRLSPKIWLSTDASRVPLRLTIGDYSAELKR